MATRIYITSTGLIKDTGKGTNYLTKRGVYKEQSAQVSHLIFPAIMDDSAALVGAHTFLWTGQPFIRPQIAGAAAPFFVGRSPREWNRRLARM